MGQGLGVAVMRAIEAPRWQQIGDYAESTIRPGVVVTRTGHFTEGPLVGEMFRTDIGCIDGKATIVVSEWTTAEMLRSGEVRLRPRTRAYWVVVANSVLLGICLNIMATGLLHLVAGAMLP